MKLVLLGAPASGKGTQAVLLGEYFRVPVVSTGVMIRQEVEKATELGRQADLLLRQGKLLPDAETLCIVESWLTTDISPAKGFILDGFPRTVPQARAFDQMLRRWHLTLDAVLLLDVRRQTIEQRILLRLQCGACGHVFQAKDSLSDGAKCPDCQEGVLCRRSDDTQPMLEKRLAEYEQKTAPVERYYRTNAPEILKTIDGNRSADRVFASILAVLGVNA